MNGKTVRVRYDETDMRSVYVFDLKTDSFIGEWKSCERINQALANQTEKDRELIIRGESHNKAIETKIKERASKMRKEAIEQLGEPVEPIDPFSFRKEQVNANEDSELKRLYEFANIDPEKVNDRPQYAVKNPYNSDPQPKDNNRLHSKKFEKQTVFPVYVAQEPDEDEDQ